MHRTLKIVCISALALTLAGCPMRRSAPPKSWHPFEVTNPVTKSKELMTHCVIMNWEVHFKHHFWNKEMPDKNMTLAICHPDDVSDKDVLKYVR